MLITYKVEGGNDITQEKYEHLKKEYWFKAYNTLGYFNEYVIDKQVSTDTDLKIKFDYRFVNGILKDEIKSAALEEKVDLIVVPLGVNSGLLKISYLLRIKKS